jgi:hypothetical protein
MTEQFLDKIYIYNRERDMHRTFSLDIPQIPRTGHWGFKIVSMNCDKTVVADCVIQVLFMNCCYKVTLTA